MTHHQFEILTITITSLIETVFDIDNILKGIFENQTETFRYLSYSIETNILNFIHMFRSNVMRDVYSLLGDLIDWGDQVFIEQKTDSKNEIEANNRYKQLAQDLIQAVKVKIEMFD